MTEQAERFPGMRAFADAFRAVFGPGVKPTFASNEHTGDVYGVSRPGVPITMPPPAEEEPEAAPKGRPPNMRYA